MSSISYRARFRPAASFTLAGGAPVPGNTSFTLTADNFTAHSTSFAIIGFPNPITVPVLDGNLAFDPFLPYGVLASLVTDINGHAELPAPLPPGMFGAVFTLSWIYVDSFTFAVHISNGLTFTI